MPNEVDNKGSDLKQRLASLYSYLAKHLGIKTTPKVAFKNDEKNAADPFGMTGHYDPKLRIIRINVTGRHDTDILRTFAHEVIHHWQNERGTLTPQHGDVADAGHYAQNDTNLRKREMEAYLFGNILFRDWQDENRMGPPKVKPFMPQPIAENFQLDAQRLKPAVQRFVDALINSKTFSSYHRERTSGDMGTSDFANDLSRKLMSTIQGWVQKVNDRGNWENQPNMIKEVMDAPEVLIQKMADRLEDTIIEWGEHVIAPSQAMAILQHDFRYVSVKSRVLFTQVATAAMEIVRKQGKIGDSMTECKKCGHKCDQRALPECRMGSIKCPKCNEEIDQEGNYGRV